MNIRGRWPLTFSVVIALLLSGCADLQPELESAWNSVKSAFSDEEKNGKDAETASADSGSRPSSDDSGDDSASEDASSPSDDSSETDSADASGTDDSEPAENDSPYRSAADEDTAEQDDGRVSQEDIARLEEDEPGEENALAREDRLGQPNDAEPQATDASDTAPAENFAQQERERRMQARIEALQRQMQELQQQTADTRRQQAEAGVREQRIAALQQKIDRMERGDPATPDSASRQRQTLYPPQSPRPTANWENLRNDSDADDKNDPWRRAAPSQSGKFGSAAARPVIANKPPPLPKGLVVNTRPAENARPASHNPNSGFASVLGRVAATAAANGNHATAVKMYRRAMRLSPDRVEPALGLGRSLSALGDHQGAVAASRAALKIDPANPDAQLRLGRALMALDLPHEAIPHLEYAAGRRANPQLYNDLGVAQDMVGDASSAQAYYRGGLQIANDDLELMSNLGISLALSGKFGEAIPLLQRSASHQAANVRHRENLAFAYVLAGDRRNAREVSLRDLSPDEAEARLDYYAMLAGMNRSGDRKAIVTVLAGRKHSLSDVAEAHRRLQIASGIPRKSPTQIARDQRQRDFQTADAAPPEAGPRPGTDGEAEWNVGDAASRASPERPAAPIETARRPHSTPELSVSELPPLAEPRSPPSSAARGFASRIPDAGVGERVYHMQLGAYPTPGLAERGWRRLNRYAPDLFRHRDHFVRGPNPDYSWDRLYRLRSVVPGGRAEANRLCGQIRRRSLECLVVESRMSASHPRVARSAPGGQAASRSRDMTAMSRHETLPPRLRANRPADSAVAATTNRASDAAPTGLSTRSRVGAVASRTTGNAFAYEVQLGAYRKPAHAARGWRILSRAAPDLLGDIDHEIRGPNPMLRPDRLYRLRTDAYEDPVMASMLCRLLKERDIDCLVVRTRPADNTARRITTPGTRTGKPAKTAALGPTTTQEPTLPEDRAMAFIAPDRPAARGPAKVPPTARPAATFELQLGAYRSRAAAQRNIVEFAQAAPDVARELDITVRRGRSAGLYLLRSRPFREKAIADELCSELNARMLNCVVFESPQPATPRAEATAPPVPVSKAPARRSAAPAQASRGEAYQVQFSAHRTPAKAVETWHKIKGSVPQLLRDTDFIVTASSPAGGFITQYRLRTQAFASWESADALCRNLKRNNVTCRVVITEDPASLLGDIGFAPAPQQAERSDGRPRQLTPDAMAPRAATAAPEGQATSTAAPGGRTPN